MRRSTQDVRINLLGYSSMIVAGVGGIFLGRLVPEDLIALRCVMWALGVLIGGAGATLIWTRIIDSMSVFDERAIVSEDAKRRREEEQP